MLTPVKKSRHSEVPWDDRHAQLMGQFDRIVSLGSTAFMDDGGIANPRTPSRGMVGKEGDLCSKKISRIFMFFCVFPKGKKFS